MIISHERSIPLTCTMNECDGQHNIHNTAHTSHTPTQYRIHHIHQHNTTRHTSHTPTQHTRYASMDYKYIANVNTKYLSTKEYMTPVISCMSLIPSNFSMQWRKQVTTESSQLYFLQCLLTRKMHILYNINYLSYLTSLCLLYLHNFENQQLQN